MRLNVHVHGLRFVVPCGEGAQSFKWLGLVVAQRYALSAPHGRCRTREDAHLKPGFFLPANITKTQDGQVLPPAKKIAELCRDNDEITVYLQQEVPVNEIGTPQFSPWTTSAFASQPRTTSATASATLDVQSARRPSAAGSSKAEAKNPPTPSGHGEHKAGAKGSAAAEAKHPDAEIREYARSELLQQVNSGLFQSEMELEAAFLYDWSRLRVDELERDAKEREAIQAILQGCFAQINAVYMHYAVGSGEVGYGMTGHEFAHFVHESGLYHFERDLPAIDTIFATCMRIDVFVSLYDRETLTRVGFFHALLRAIVQSPREPGGSGSTREVLEKKLKERVLPAIARLTSGPFRDHTHNDRTVAIFQEAKPKLLKLYGRYAAEELEKQPKREAPTTAPGWPHLLSSSALKSMLYDCGVFCVGDAKAHEELFGKALDQCFSGMRDSREGQGAVVFAEFVEVLARVGVAVLEESNVPPRDAIKIAVDALRSLPIRAHRK